MPKGSPELTATRREEIMNACAQLYMTKRPNEITMGDIGAVTSFTRTSIYNYFQTKEEIFLALLEREYVRWTAELTALAAAHDALSPAGFAEAVAQSLAQHELLLKLLSMDHYNMEENARLERLVTFKVAYGASLDAMRACLAKFFPETDRERFLFVFFPFLFGVYPYAVATEKQLEAMRQAEIGFRMHSIYEMVYACITALLG